MSLARACRNGRPRCAARESAPIHDTSLPCRHEQIDRGGQGNAPEAAAFALRGRSSGFTLVEVLLALGLFVIASGVLAGAIYSGLQAYRGAQSDADIENRYRLVLRQVLSISDRTEFERGGTLRLPDGTVADWDAMIEDDSQLLDLFNVNVTVRLSGNLPSTAAAAVPQQERDFHLYLYRATWSDAGDRGRLLDERRRALEDRREGR